MKSNESYAAKYDERAKEIQMRAKKLIYRYNNTEPDMEAERKAILQNLFYNDEINICIEPPFHCDYGFNITIGEKFYANHNLVILDCNKVTFGDNVFIGPNCGFYAAAHPIDKDVRKELEFSKPITVGNDVWIGGNVCVLPGVTIGDNVVIGAGSVVTKDIPSNVVAAGNPCRVIRNI